MWLLSQVVQFLLASNYYCTGLELLVESQQAGRGEDFDDLQVRMQPGPRPSKAWQGWAGMGSEASVSMPGRAPSPASGVRI